MVSPSLEIKITCSPVPVTMKIQDPIYKRISIYFDAAYILKSEHSQKIIIRKFQDCLCLSMLKINSLAVMELKRFFIHKFSIFNQRNYCLPVLLRILFMQCLKIQEITFFFNIKVFFSVYLLSAGNCFFVFPDCWA